MLALFQGAGRAAVPVRQFFLAVVIAIPLGIFQAVRRNTIGDNVATTLASYPRHADFFLHHAIQVLALNFPIFSLRPASTPEIAIISTYGR